MHRRQRDVCPYCQTGMRLMTRLRSTRILPALTTYWCESCRIEITFEGQAKPEKAKEGNAAA